MLRQVHSGLKKSILQRSLVALLDQHDHIRAFSRRRHIPEKQTRKPLTKEEYRQSILENARLRREAAQQQEDLNAAAVAALHQIGASGETEDSDDLKSEEISEEEDGDEASEIEISGEEDRDEASEVEISGEEVEEESSLTEKELFIHLLDYQEQPREQKPQRYVPFVPSEDDDAYEPEPEESFIAKTFSRMERDNELREQESQALYPEEEVVVKLVHFEATEEKPPVRLKLKASSSEEVGKVLYLRRSRDIQSTKTKLFQRLNTQHITVLKQCDLGPNAEERLVEPLQRILDICMASEEVEFAEEIFRQIRYHSDAALCHIRDLSGLLPPTLDLIHLARCVPSILLLKNKAALEIGMECAGAIYPALHLFRKTFKLGLCHVELMEDVLRLGSLFLSMQKCLAKDREMTIASFKDILEDVNAIVPNFAKVVESMGGSIPAETIATVMQWPELTRKRIELCKKKVYNWQDFNLYAYGDFTLSLDESKFNQYDTPIPCTALQEMLLSFCEMYNMTRKLQLDFAEQLPDPEQGDIPDTLYFWKQNWMFNEQHAHHKLPNGILPHQFTSIYAAYEVLTLEGLTWSAFLKGLSILSEQREVGVYEEVHFYEKLRTSRERSSLSIVLRNGVINVMRMMCRQEQIRMELEPQTTESPLYEVKPIHIENEIFA